MIIILMEFFILEPLKNVYILGSFTILFSHILDFTIDKETLTYYLPLLFVPVGVGVVMHLSYLKNNHFIILIIIFLSTLLTIGITALLMSKLSKKND